MIFFIEYLIFGLKKKLIKKSVNNSGLINDDPLMKKVTKLVEPV
jgi:hypothetical protein